MSWRPISTVRSRASSAPSARFRFGRCGCQPVPADAPESAAVAAGMGLTNVTSAAGSSQKSSIPRIRPWLRGTAGQL